jgi:hypothetical protein
VRGTVFRELRESLSLIVGAAATMVAFVAVALLAARAIG